MPRAAKRDKINETVRIAVKDIPARLCAAAMVAESGRRPQTKTFNSMKNRLNYADTYSHLSTELLPPLP